MTEKKTTIYTESVYTKEGKRCILHTEKNPTKDSSKVWGSEYNPFPCFYMMTVYITVHNWLIADGWEYKGKLLEVVTEDLINSETGEITYHNCRRTEFKTTPATETKETIPELLRQGNRVHAIRLYRRLTDCGLKDAIDYVDSIKANLNL